jgi:hypothetical protein
MIFTILNINKKIFKLQPERKYLLLVLSYQCFTGTSCLHLQGQRVSQGGSHHETGCKQNCTCSLVHAGFLLALFSVPEGRCDMFLKNICELPLDYTALLPRTKNSS